MKITIEGNDVNITGLPSNHEEPDQVLNVKQAAEMLQVSENTIRRWAIAGVIPGLISGGIYRFSRKAIMATITGRALPALQESQAVNLPCGKG